MKLLQEVRKFPSTDLKYLLKRVLLCSTNTTNWWSETPYVISLQFFLCLVLDVGCRSRSERALVMWIGLGFRQLHASVCVAEGHWTLTVKLECSGSCVQRTSLLRSEVFMAMKDQMLIFWVFTSRRRVEVEYKMETVSSSEALFSASSIAISMD
jgi:hypothetical protein